MYCGWILARPANPQVNRLVTLQAKVSRHPSLQANRPVTLQVKADQLRRVHRHPSPKALLGQLRRALRLVLAHLRVPARVHRVRLVRVSQSQLARVSLGLRQSLHPRALVYHQALPSRLANRHLRARRPQLLVQPASQPVTRPVLARVSQNPQVPLFQNRPLSRSLEAHPRALVHR